MKHMQFFSGGRALTAAFSLATMVVAVLFFGTALAGAQADGAPANKAPKPAAKTAAKPPAKKAPAPKQAALVPPQPVTSAVAHLQPTAGNKVSGKVEFKKVTGGIRITAAVSGFAPGSEHGFHIHEVGDCSAADATSAGGHFTSQGAMHSGPESKRGKRHEGDLGNLVADGDGNAKYERVDKVIALLGRQSILGRSVIVHADVDDLATQPTGNAGPRMACGVIGVAK